MFNMTLILNLTGDHVNHCLNIKVLMKKIICFLKDLERQLHKYRFKFVAPL